jgi:hypothetical protein
MLVKTIVPVANNGGQSGLELKSAFSVETVPQAIVAQHDQIISCIDYRIELTNAIVNVLNAPAGAEFPDLDQDPCNLLPAAKQTIAAYVREHSP